MQPNTRGTLAGNGGWYSLTLSRCHASSFAPSPVCPLHSVLSWYLRALPRDPSPSYRSSSGSGLLRGHLAVASPVQSPRTLRRCATVGRLSLSVRAKFPSSLSPTLASLVSLPPCLGIRTNEMTGGGDFHRSLSLPSFRGLTLYKIAAAVPWVCVRAEGDHDCMVVSSS